MFLSQSIDFYQILMVIFLLDFQRRDLVLVAASVLFMIGLSPSIGVVPALIVAFVIYFGIKVFVGRQRRRILADTGTGLCADCGAKLDGTRCPTCNFKP